MEAKEDFEDIQRRERIVLWNKNDERLKKLHSVFEGYPSFPSGSPVPPFPSVKSVTEVLKGLGGREGLEGVINYLIDLLTRCGFLLDKQINSVEERHRTEGGYTENLLRKRLEYKSRLK